MIPKHQSKLANRDIYLEQISQKLNELSKIQKQIGGGDHTMTKEIHFFDSTLTDLYNALNNPKNVHKYKRIKNEIKRIEKMKMYL